MGSKTGYDHVRDTGTQGQHTQHSARAELGMINCQLVLNGGSSTSRIMMGLTRCFAAAACRCKAKFAQDCQTTCRFLRKRQCISSAARPLIEAKANHAVGAPTACLRHTHCCTSHLLKTPSQGVASLHAPLLQRQHAANFLSCTWRYRAN